MLSKDNTKQTPSNTVCSNGSQAGWGSDGQVHCFKQTSNNTGNTSTYPTGSFHEGGGSNSGGSNNFGTGGSSGGVNTHGGSNAYGYNYGSGKHAYNISFKSIMDRTSSPAHGYLIPEKTINLRYNNLTDKEIAVLVGNLQYQQLDLDVFDVSNNKIGFGGVENLFYGLRFDNTLAGRDIVTMNFSNNLIGDDGAKYMADSLAMGRFLNLKSLNVSGNQITGTGEGYFAKALESVKVTSITIVLTTKNSFKEIANFIKTGFNYYAKEFHIEQIAVDVDTQKYLTNCQKTGINLTEGFMSGFVKCKNIPNKKIAFFCFINEVVDSLFQPETLNCLIDSHKFFEHDVTSLTGSSSDQDIHHQECNIF